MSLYVNGQTTVNAHEEYNQATSELAEAKEMLKESQGEPSRRPHAAGDRDLISSACPSRAADARLQVKVVVLCDGYAGDPEMVELAQEEVNELQTRINELEEQLRLLLLPKDPLDDKNIMLEVRDPLPLPLPTPPYPI